MVYQHNLTFKGQQVQNTFLNKANASHQYKKLVPAVKSYNNLGSYLWLREKMNHSQKSSSSYTTREVWAGYSYQNRVFWKP